MTTIAMAKLGNVIIFTSVPEGTSTEDAKSQLIREILTATNGIEYTDWTKAVVVTRPVDDPVTKATNDLVSVPKIDIRPFSDTGRDSLIGHPMGRGH